MAVQTRLGKYEVLGEIGRGAMGVVYRAYDVTLERHVALKTMQLGDHSKAGENAARFLREARSAGGLRHPNIVTIYELGEDRGTPFIAMELMEGVDLERVLESRRELALDRRLEIVAQVCDGLHFAHAAGIVHRDVKPANVFLTDDGQVKILDFGIAKLAASDATKTGTIIGTVDYMSPEQIRADKQLDGRSDQFSAGVILYQLLFGAKPFEGEHLAATMYRIVHLPADGSTRFHEILPLDLASVLKKVLAKNPEERFTDCGALSAELRRLAAQLKGETGAAASAAIARSLARGGLERRDAPEQESTPETTVQVDSAREIDAPTENRPSRRPQGRRSAPILIIGAGVLMLVLLVLGLALRSEKDVQGGGVSTLGHSSPGGEEAVRSEIEAPVAAASERETSTPAPPMAERAETPESKVPQEKVSERSASEAKTPSLEATASPPKQDAAHAVDSSAPPRHFGRVGVTSTPSAEIVSIEDLQTGEVIPSRRRTPVVLDLPAGRYLITLQGGEAAEPLLAEVKVVANQMTRIFRRIPGFDQNAWVSRFIQQVEADRIRHSEEKR